MALLSPKQRQRNFFSRLLFILIALLILVGVVAIGISRFHIFEGIPASLSTQVGIGITSAPDGEQIGISDGTYSFDTGPDRLDRELKKQASDKLKAGDTTGAQALWTQAHSQDTNDAEILIYLEDQRVLASHAPYITLVVGTMLTGTDTSIIGTGRDNLQGAYIAQKEYNDGHILPNNVQMRLLIANSGSQAAYATPVAQQIVQAAKMDPTIVGVMGWPFSSRAVNVVKVLGPARIPMVSPTASSDVLTGTSPFFFRVAPSNKSQAIAGAKYAEQRLHARQVALFVDSADPYSSTLAQDFSKQFTADGNNIVVTEGYTVGAKGQGNLPALLQDALSHNPDVIYFSGYAADISVVLANLPTSGPFAKLQIMGGDALYELNGYSSAARATFSRLHFTAFAHPDEWDAQRLTAQKPAFFRVYAHTFDPDGLHTANPYGYLRPDNDVILSYDAMLALLQGSKNALSGSKTSLTSNELQQGLAKITGSQAIQGVGGQISFGSDGDPINKAIVILSVDTNGSIQLEGIQSCFLVGRC